MSSARIHILSLLAIALLFTSACGRSGSSSDIQARYDTMNAALKAKDVDGFMAGFTADFEQVGADKTTLRREKIQELAKAVTKEADSIESRSVVEKASFSGDRADVTVTTTQKMTVKEPTSDKTHTFEITSTMQDVWKKEGSEWKLLQSTELKHAASKDGEPLPTSTTAPRK